MEPEELRGLLDTARVPFRFWDMNMQAVDGLERARAYFIEGGQYANDKLDGIGVVFHGNHRQINPLMPLVARGLVIRDVETMYVDLSDIIEDRDEPESSRLIYSKAYEVEALVVDQFDNGEQFPYTLRERRILESLFRARINAGMLTYFGAVNPVMASDWWSDSFRTLVDTHTRSIGL